MKTAIIYSGQARTFRHVFKNQWWYVLRRFPDAHVFASVADDENAADMELLKSRIATERVHIERIEQPDCTALLGLTKETAEIATRGAPMAVSSPAESILRQLWHLHRAFKFAHERSHGINLDAYVRIRPDIHFHRFVAPGFAGCGECMSPWWGGYGGINDRFAVMGSHAAGDYFGTWEKITRLIEDGCPLHPESLVAASLERGGTKSWRVLQAEFSALRPSGQLVWPDMQLYDLSR